MENLFTQHLSELITGIIAVFVGWFGKSRISKRSENADLTQKIQEIYKDMIAHTEQRIEENNTELERLKKTLQEKDLFWQEELEKAEQKWAKKYETLKRENASLKKRIAELEKL